MKVNLSLVFEHKDAKLIYNSMLPDFGKKGRADVNMILDKRKILFNIVSEDLTSVRATINSILLKLRSLQDISNKDI
jgi:tRNA threonylcarbamoyladenosine modification (KEOPS) complex  Pcc1 subunit